jgi:putative GTP pyrophosphokinase
MSKEALQKRYEARSAAYRQLISETRFILANGIREQGIRIQYPILSRLKAFESFYEKTVRKSIKSDPFDEINDIAALRVVCIYRDDLGKMSRLVQESFDVVKVDEKVVTTPTTEFGYMSNHYIVKLPPRYSGKRYDDIKHLKCEVQVRTLLMHAWAVASHDLQYKKDIDIPAELKRDFYALSGLLHLADSQLEIFRKARETFRTGLMARNSQALDLNQEMNLDTLFAFLRSRVADRAMSSPQDYSRLLSELRQAGYNKLSRLSSAFDRAYPVFESYESRKPAKGTPSGRYVDVGVVRLSLAMVDSCFAELAHLDTREIAEYAKLISAHRQT